MISTRLEGYKTFLKSQAIWLVQSSLSSTNQKASDWDWRIVVLPSEALWHNQLLSIWLMFHLALFFEDVKEQHLSALEDEQSLGRFQQYMQTMIGSKPSCEYLLHVLLGRWFTELVFSEDSNEQSLAVLFLVELELYLKPYSFNRSIFLARAVSDAYGPNSTPVVNYI